MTLQRRALALALAAALATARESRAQSPAQSLALTHVTVIDMTGGPPQADMTVVTSDGRIRSVGPGSNAHVPAGARVVDATGKFVIPGLWDMHVHLAQWPESALLLLVAHGVTGVRDMGSDLTAVRRAREGVVSGATRVGPRIVAAGGILDGMGHSSEERINVATAADGRRLVDSLAAAGADFIKVYEFLARDVFRAIAAEAKVKGLPFAGHVPRDVGAIGAADAGQHSVEHLSGVPLPCSGSMRWLGRTPGLRGMMPPCGDDRARDEVFEHFRRADSWVTPTLVSLRGVARAIDAAALTPAAEPRMKYVTADVLAHWHQQIAKWPKLVPSDYRRTVAELYTRVATAAHEARVSFLVGSDLGNTLVFPGSSTHDEIELLVRAGLTPMEGLQAATAGPARYLHASDTLGTIGVGKVADMVVLDANPLEDIANIRRVNAVVRAGVLLDRAALDRLINSASR
jgi:imidazolonepropionase-like amidohydrolase